MWRRESRSRSSINYSSMGPISSGMNHNLYNMRCILVLLLLSSLTASHPPNPCPDLFRYQFDGTEWYGVIQLRNIAVGQTVNLNVNLSLRALLPTNYVGILELLEGRQKATQAVVARNPVLYKIRFPLQNPLPRITEIAANNQVLCNGPQEVGPEITKIHLEHTFYTTVLDRFSVRPSSQFNQFNQPFTENINKFTQSLTDTLFSNTFDPSSAFGNSLPSSGSINSNNVNNGLNFGPTSNKPGNQNSGSFGLVIGSPDILNNRPPFGSSGNTNFWSPNSNNQFQQSLLPTPTPSNPPQNNDNICGQVDPKYNIKRLVVGGEKIKAGSWPWLAAVYLSEAGALEFKCGGSLVSSTVTVSAAHCFMIHQKQNNPENVLVALGRFNLRNWNEAGSIMMGSSSIHIHPDYADDLSTFDADIAVVVLKSSISFTDTIRPVCLWSGTSNVQDIEGDDGTIVGWGRDESGNEVSAEPKKVHATIYSSTTCVRSNNLFRPITSKRTFCAGLRNGEGPCTGDSGSGLMIFRNNRWELRGTVAGSLSDTKTNTCNLNEFIVYVDIMQFRDWINSFI